MVIKPELIKHNTYTLIICKEAQVNLFLLRLLQNLMTALSETVQIVTYQIRTKPVKSGTLQGCH